MSIPYGQLYSSGNTIPRSPYMRLPSYKSLRRRRLDGAEPQLVRGRGLISWLKEPAEDTDFEVDMLLTHVNPIPVSFSLATILEDDDFAGLRTVVSQMIGRDSAQSRLGSVHLVIDFALIVRSRLRKNGGAVHNDVAMTLPPTTLGLSM